MSILGLVLCIVVFCSFFFCSKTVCRVFNLFHKVENSSKTGWKSFCFSWHNDVSWLHESWPLGLRGEEWSTIPRILCFSVSVFHLEGKIKCTGSHETACPLSLFSGHFTCSNSKDFGFGNSLSHFIGHISISSNYIVWSQIPLLYLVS